MRRRVEPDGVVRCLYSEVIDLSTFGAASIQPASNVEPDEHGGWWADLAPVKGPRLGSIRLAFAGAGRRTVLVGSPLVLHPIDALTSSVIADAFLPLLQQ